MAATVLNLIFSHEDAEKQVKHNFYDLSKAYILGNANERIARAKNYHVVSWCGEIILSENGTRLTDLYQARINENITM